jgi:hypothetical protein
MKIEDKMKKIQMQLRKKEYQARDAKEKGMHTTYGNLMLEINELKKEVRKMSMGGR